MFLQTGIVRTMLCCVLEAEVVAVAALERQQVGAEAVQVFQLT